MPYRWTLPLALSLAVAMPAASQATPLGLAKPGVICRDGTRSLVSGRGACVGHGGVRSDSHAGRTNPHDQHPKSTRTHEARGRAKPHARHAHPKPMPKRKPTPKPASKPHARRAAHRAGLRRATPARSEIRIARDGNPLRCTDGTVAPAGSSRGACRGQSTRPKPTRRKP